MNHLNDIRQQARSYWSGLSRREQWLTMVASVFLLVWVFWQAVVVPMADRSEQAERNLLASQQELSRVRGVADNIVQLRQGQPERARYLGLPLDELVNKTARNHTIRVTGVRSQRDSLQVQLGETGFDRLVAWLQVLESQGGVQILELSVETSAKPGQVRVDTLRIGRS